MKEDTQCECEHDELWEDFLNLAELYSERMSPQEFGFGLIRMATKLLADCTDNGLLASSTAMAGVMEGLKWKMEENRGNEES